VPVEGTALDGIAIEIVRNSPNSFFLVKVLTLWFIGKSVI